MELHISYQPDRVEAGTFMIATVVCGGDVAVKPVIFDDNVPLISSLELGVDLRIENGKKLKSYLKKKM